MQDLIIFIIILSLTLFFSIRRQKLTLTGNMVALLLAIIIFEGAGLDGIFLLGSFFFISVLATALNRRQQPEYVKLETEKRDWKQVLANGGTAALLSTAIILHPEQHHLLLLMIASAFSSATADTVSSELGTVYGKRFVNIISFKRDRKGENGVISLEGTMCGVAASILIAVVYCIFTGFDMASLLFIVIAGTAGNLFDSLLGATLERNNLIGNNAVNFLNTLFAASLGGALALVIS